MKEDFLHYIWKFQLFEHDDLRSIDGEPIEIISTGNHNHHSGPDFSAARIRINDTTWAGNVEIHQKSSDWYRHNHQMDPAYNNVILHVVGLHDKEVINTSGNGIPTLSLSNRISDSHFRQYQKLFQNQTWIPCERSIKNAPEIQVFNMMQKSLVERVERKSDYVFSVLKMHKMNWEQTLFQMLARNFGFKLNAEPFELLAKTLPYQAILKHHDHLNQVQALLFGQSGLLNTDFNDPFPLELKKEFNFLKKKFHLKELDSKTWKFMRSRPNNFPSVRIAQLALILHRQPQLFASILDSKSVKDFEVLFKSELQDYWIDHYRFDQQSKPIKKSLGKNSIENIIVNTVVPILFTYANQKNDLEFRERAVTLLEELPPESNNVIKKWKNSGVDASNGFDSQALLEMKQHYCDTRKCLSCNIGISLLNRST